MTVTVEAGELATDELLSRLRAGERVVVRTTFLGNEKRVTLRFDGETFYCDTPTTLHKHETEADMRACIRDQGYGREE
jgi:hypothetical protein